MKLIEFVKNVPQSVAYLIVFYCYLAATHLALTICFSNGSVWFARVISDQGALLIVFSAFPACFASVLLLGLIRRKITLIKTGLAFAWLYHLSISLLNLIFYGGTGTPWAPALFVGLVALLLYLYQILLD